MFINSIKYTLRLLRKDKLFTLLNVLGFAMGITVCSLIAFYILNEFSYDSYQKEYKNIYLVNSKLKASKESEYTRNGYYTRVDLPFPVAQVIKDNFAEVRKAARIIEISAENSGVTINNRLISIDRCYYADPDLLEIFTYNFIRGSAPLFAAKLNSTVISKSVADKYFGGADNAIGKMVEFGEGSRRFNLEIAGVYEDVPVNSHLRPNFLLPVKLFNGGGKELWNTFNTQAYVLLNPKSGVKALEEKITLAVMLASHSKNENYKLMPLADVHINDAYITGAIGERGDLTKIYLYLSIGLLTLLVACINYINFSTAKSSMRAKEIGIRKIAGAERAGLIKQIMFEPVILAFLSMPLIILFIFLLSPYTDSLFNRELQFNLLSRWQYAASVLGVILFVGLASGVYPAIIISKNSSLGLIRWQGGVKRSWSFIRSGLMVVQVAVFAGLIIGSYVIYNQMNLVKTSNYGYSKEQTLVCSIPDDADKDKQILFINALKNMPGIVSASRASSAPPLFGVSISFSSQSDKTGKQINAQRIECDENYKDALRLKLKEGEFFSTTDMDSLQRNIVVNEKFVSVMGLKNAVGEVISSGRYDKYLIKGVIKDYNGGSLYHKINPEVFTPPEYFSILFVVKLAPQNIGRGVASLKEKWNGYFPGTFCNYRFIDEQFDRLYKEDQKFAMLIGFFAVNAIMIAVIGLAGLTTYTITRKKKEIAIRKVLGASAPDIIYTLTKEIIVITLIGCLIIMPAANYFMELWLRKFAYKIAVTPWIYVFAFSVSILITVVSVIYPAVKTAFGNQMDSLRSE